MIFENEFEPVRTSDVRVYNTYVIVEFRLFGEVDVLCVDELFDFGESSLLTRTAVVFIAVFTLFRLLCGGGYS